MSKKQNSKRIDKETSTAKSPQKKKPNDQKNNSANESNPDKVLQELEYETRTLLAKYNSLEDQVAIKQNETISELEEVNSNLGAKTEELVSLSKINKKLFDNLKSIRDEVDYQMKFTRLFNLKQQELEGTVSSLQKQIKAKEIQIKTYKKILNGEEKQNQKIKKLIEENKDGKVLEQMEKELEECENKEKELEEKKTNLKTECKQHKDCEIKVKQLQKKLEIVQNENEFFQKKSDQEKNESSKDNFSGTNINNNNKTSSKKENPNTSQKAKGNQKPENVQSKPDKNTQSPKMVKNNSKPEENKENEKTNQSKNEKKIKLKNSLSPIWNELYYINRSVQIKKNKYYEQTFLSNRKRNNSLEVLLTENTKLFLPEEKKALEKLIPQDEISNYEKKFKEMDEEKEKLRQQYLTETVKKNKQIKEIKTKVEEFNIKLKEITKQKIKLNSALSKQKSEIADLNSKISALKKGLTFFSGQYKQKLQENKFLENHINKLLEMIESGKLVKKEEEKNHDEENEEENEEDNKEAEENEEEPEN